MPNFRAKYCRLTEVERKQEFGIVMFQWQLPSNGTSGHSEIYHILFAWTPLQDANNRMCLACSQRVRFVVK
jgi:hypothetical protein